MSELTQCNYCSLQAYRRRARRRGTRIVLERDDFNWIGVYELPKGLRVSEFRKLPIGNSDDRTGRAKYKVASFMELSRQCCC